MKLAQAVVEAYKRKWSYVNNFSVTIGFANEDTAKNVGWTENGCKVILLTGRGKETLSISLAKLDAFKYFDGFYTGSTLGEVKCELLNELMEEYGFSNNEIVFAILLQHLSRVIVQIVFFAFMISD